MELSGNDEIFVRKLDNSKPLTIKFVMRAPQDHENGESSSDYVEGTSNGLILDSDAIRPYIGGEGSDVECLIPPSQRFEFTFTGSREALMGFLFAFVNKYGNATIIPRVERYADGKEFHEVTHDRDINIEFQERFLWSADLGKDCMFEYEPGFNAMFIVHDGERSGDFNEFMVHDEDEFLAGFKACQAINLENVHADDISEGLMMQDGRDDQFIAYNEDGSSKFNDPECCPHVEIKLVNIDTLTTTAKAEASVRIYDIKDE